MSARTDIEQEIAELQRKLAILNQAPADTFTFGTLVVFASGVGGKTKWYYAKTAEETWLNFKTGVEKDLASWILEAKDSGIGYFEVYELKVQPTPIYASA